MTSFALFESGPGAVIGFVALDRGASPSPLQQHAAQQSRAPSAHQQLVDNFIAQNSGIGG